MRLAFAHEWMRQRDALPRVRYSTRRRRIIVATHYLLLAFLLFTLPGASLRTTMPEAEVVGLILALVALAWLMLFVSASVGNFAARGVKLDEREQAQRDRATAISYRVLQAAIVAVTGYAIMGTNWKLGLPMPTNAGQLMMFLIPLYFFALTLPTAVLAWTLPDPDPEPGTEPEPAPD